jgi:ADP-ribose pyrophosphatase
VVVIPLTKTGAVVLVRQYRPAIAQTTWELPAGSLKAGEDPAQAAIRECHEETGLVPGHIDRLGAFYPTPGYCDELMNFYRATDLREPREDERAEPDEDEDIETREFSWHELRALIGAGGIIDLKTIAGLSLVRKSFR